jgi:hypothetical protein
MILKKFKKPVWGINAVANVAHIQATELSFPNEESMNHRGNFLIMQKDWKFRSC